MTQTLICSVFLSTLHEISPSLRPPTFFDASAGDREVHGTRGQSKGKFGALARGTWAQAPVSQHLGFGCEGVVFAHGASDPTMDGRMDLHSKGCFLVLKIAKYWGVRILRAAKMSGRLEDFTGGNGHPTQLRSLTVHDGVCTIPIEIYWVDWWPCIPLRVFFLLKAFAIYII